MYTESDVSCKETLTYPNLMYPETGTATFPKNIPYVHFPLLRALQKTESREVLRKGMVAAYQRVVSQQGCGVTRGPSIR
jgi:hypothetical protein